MIVLRRLLVFLLLALSCALSAVAAPSVTTLVPAAGASVSSLTQISVTFSEPVTGVNADDLLLNNDPAATVSGSGPGPYVFTFTQPLPGTINISWDFDHGIAGIGTGAFAQNTWSYTLIDTLAPTIRKVKTSVAGQDMDAITPYPGTTVTALTSVEVYFSEPVTGVDAADLLINGVPAASMTGSDVGPYVFSFAQPAAGAVNFQWAASTGIADLAANAFGGGSWSVNLNAAGPGSVIINEFLAANATSIVDEDGSGAGWIELYNPGATPVNVAGWSITNDPDQPSQFLLPNRTIAAGGYLVIFASGKDRKPASGYIHANFKLNPNGGYLALYGPAYPRGAASSASFFNYPVQRFDYSYGLITGGAARYFARGSITPDPRPGTANGASTLVGITPQPTLSVSRGFFKDAFPVVISCADPSATIRYTLDGSDVTAASTVYTTPLTVSATTILRTAAFSSTAIPSATVTNSYIFLDQVLSQPSPPYDNPAITGDESNPKPPTVGSAAFPVAWGSVSGVGFPGLITNLSANQVPADYGMDSAILNDANKYDDTGAINNVTGKTNLERVKAGLRELPIMSVVLKNDDMFGAAGLYPNATLKGTTYEKPCSVELLLPDGTTGFATTCGLRIHGNASRNPQNNPKHGFKLNFKGDFGASSLEYQLFPDSPVTKFDDIILRADYNSSWLHWDGSTTLGAAGGQRARGTRLRDAWSKDTFRAMGRPAGHHRYVNLFINGVYWGTYDPTEQQNNGFAAAYYGGSKDDFDVMEQGTLKSGTQTAYNTMTAIASPIDNPKYEQMKQYLDVPEFVDYMLFHFFVGHQDWGDDINKNWYAVRPKANGTYKFLPWDLENLLWDPTIDRTTVTLPAAGLHPKLVTNPQYLLDFADRVHRHMVAPDGALQPAANIARWNKWQTLLTNAIAGEAARWGDYRLKVHQYSSGPYVAYTWNKDWIAECNRLKQTYFPNRITSLSNPTLGVLPQLRSRGLYPWWMRHRSRRMTRPVLFSPVSG